MSEPEHDDAATEHASGAPVVSTQADDLEPALETLPFDQRRAIVEVVEQQLSHSGPLPAPRQLKEYDEVLPGLAERIVSLTEREQKHRHDIIDFALKRSARLRDRGQWFGLIALVLMLAFCAMLASLDHPETAGFVAVGLIVGVVSVFVIGRNADVREAAVQDEAD